MSDKCLVNSCCCGCSLRTGSMITAVFCLISGLVNVINAAYHVTQTHENAIWFNVVIYALMLIAAILLLHGVRKDNPRLIRIWIYAQIALNIFVAIATAIVVIKNFDLNTLIAVLIVIAFNVYFIVVVRSFAIELENKGGPANVA